MRNKRLCPASTIAILAAMATTPASAAGFGAAAQVARLGQPLDFVAVLRLDAGEVALPECVDAEVTFGERRLPAAQVRTRIEARGAGAGGVHVRVLTTPAVDEPVIGVTLGVGCQARLSRRYVVLADPPHSATATAAVVTVPALARASARAGLLAVSMRAAATPGSARPPSGGESAAGGAAARAALESAPASGPASEPASEPVPEPAPRTAALAAPSAAPRAAARPERRSQRSPPTRTRAPAPGPQRLLAVAPTAPRLRLDFAESPPVAEAAAVELALHAVAQAASVAQASAAAASATAARIAALEHTVERLGREAATYRDEAAQLRQQLAQADGAGRWKWSLLFTGTLLAALAGWLAWRLSSLQREPRQGWLAAISQPAPDANGADATPSRQATAPIPFVTSEVRLPAAASAARTQAGPGAASAPPGSDAGPGRSPGLARAMSADIAAARDVSIEELIDLEQQAEFFVVLGQDEAAIDLLMQQLRDTGGSSPLPYLRLLEIHHRRGDRLAYERTRESFKHRFNADAPAWEVGLAAGCSLEDYAGVVPRLQQVWPRPPDAMAELEALLFRKSRGELFDLPAYREVLFLYALARDLLVHDAVDPHHVDLLLPLADGSEYGNTAPAPLFELAHKGGAAGLEADDRAGTAVDLDLTQAARPTSIFDLLPSTAPGPRA
jgi:hypothetical protein